MIRKFGLLVTRPVSSTKNIGDYIQSLAAKQFIPSDDYCLIDKETISKFSSSEPVKVIMNAWYMWHPENWPPQDCIVPLLTSIHLTPLTASQMLNENGKSYMINHGPIGCRDTGTKDILDKAGIPCYFSGCLTLTLGLSFSNQGLRNGLLFVDPFVPAFRYVADGISKIFPHLIIKSLFYYAQNPFKVNALIQKHSYFKSKYLLKSLYKASMFYHLYKSKFSFDTLLEAEYITHLVPSEGKSDKQLLEEAEALVKKYASAKLVVTSRIHCALPCIGLNTPCVFVLSEIMNAKNNVFNAPNRFGGLIDFFRVFTIKNGLLVSKDKELIKYDRITKDLNLSNKDNWKPYRDNLVAMCNKFIKDGEIFY